jgi:predicted Fe-Mo cluster-binding NifX family protein
MRIAIPITDGQVAPHLGICQRFLIADVEAGQVIREAEVENPGHGPGGPPPAFLIRQGVTHVVCWGVPVHAREILRNSGVDVTLGATGDPRQVLSDYLKGTLELTTEGLDGGGGCHCH